jgi:hypothetical protein
MFFSPDGSGKHLLNKINFYFGSKSGSYFETVVKRFYL